MTLLPGFLAPALAGMNISIEPSFTVITAGASPDVVQQVTPLVTGLPDLLVADLADALGSLENADCGAAVIARGKDREAILKELKLQKSRYVTPSTRGQAKTAKLTKPNTMIGGNVTITPAGLEVTLLVKSWPGGKIASTVKGIMPNDTLFEGEDALVRELAKQLCKLKAYNFKGGLGDLQFNEVVCDISQPFTVSARGATAGIKVTLTPSGDQNGSVSAGGTAAYAQWRGGGSYTQKVDGKQGKLTMTITFSGSVMGHSTATTTNDYPITLTAAPNCPP